MGIDLKLEQKLQQKLSPQQIQMIKLLELPVLQLEQRIKQEIEENPMLEVDEAGENDEQDDNISIEEYAKREDDQIPYYKTVSNNYSKDDKLREFVVAAGGISLQEHLIEQLRYKNMSSDMQDITRYLIGNMDADGYLRQDEQILADELLFMYGVEATVAQIDEGISIIQSLDPAGVGARDLRECLLLQLNSQANDYSYSTLTRTVLVSHFDDFSKKRYDKLMSALRLSPEQLRCVVENVRRLSPKPGNLYSGNSDESSPYVIPDFIVDCHEGKFTIQLNRRNAPELKISFDYAKEVGKLSRNAVMTTAGSSEAQRFVHSKTESAKWFINALRQRQDTLMLTMRAIIEYQQDYFITGEEHSMRPMILKDIADLTGLDVSTVSRVVNSKYVQTNFGVISLKQLFSESMRTSDGEEVSTHEVRKILQESINTENKKSPFTDEELMDILNKAGYTIARRTVAKYREALEIPVARLRKEL